MWIDFHTHTKMSKKIDFSIDYFMKMVRSAQKNGLDALALTEHFNTKRYEDIYSTLNKHFIYHHDYYDVNGFKVFPGMEVDIKEKGHILLIGNRDDIQTIHNGFVGKIEKSKFPTFEEVLGTAEQFNVLKIGAHPTRISTPLTHLSNEKLQRFDAFDLNGKDVAKQKDTIVRLQQLGQQLGKPVVCGSDSHLPVQFGCVKNQLYKDCDTIDDLRQCLIERQYEIRVSNYAALKVFAARFVKRTLKLAGQC